MNKIDLIIAEIERRLYEDYNGPDDHDNEIAQGVCAGILFFIDSLPKNEPSEDLEKEIKTAFFENKCDVAGCTGLAFCAFARIARHFANWKKEQMGKQAREHLAKTDITLADVVAFDKGMEVGRKLEREETKKK